MSVISLARFAPSVYQYGFRAFGANRGDVAVGWLKGIFVFSARSLGAVTVVFGIIAALCQLNTQCSGVMNVLIQPIWEDAVAILDGAEPVSRTSAKYSLLYQSAVENHADGEIVAACRNYISAERKLDRLETLNARIDTRACRCSIALNIKDICDNGADADHNNSAEIRDACRCDRQLPPTSQTDCLTKCTIADLSEAK